MTDFHMARRFRSRAQSSSAWSGASEEWERKERKGQEPNEDLWFVESNLFLIIRVRFRIGSLFLLRSRGKGYNVKH